MNPLHRQILKDNSKTLAASIRLEKLKLPLEESGIFTPDMLEDIKSESDLFHELPTRGPEAFERFINVLKEAGYEGEANELEREEQKILVAVVTKESFYAMSYKPIGCCLIINNVAFQNPKRYRRGAEKDGKVLCEIFEKMGFDVQEEPNKSASEMLKILKTFSENDFSKVGCSVVIILTHGAHVDNLDVIYGVDDNYFIKRNIYEKFNYDKCKTLRKKPKVFLFQCCRNENTKVIGSLVGESSDSSKIDERDPKWADMYIAHSCLPDDEAYRDFQNGTWFVQDMVEVLSQYHHECDLDAMIQLINTKLMKRVSVDENKQAIHTETFGLRGRIWLRSTNRTSMS